MRLFSGILFGALLISSLHSYPVLIGQIILRKKDGLRDCYKAVLLDKHVLKPSVGECKSYQDQTPELQYFGRKTGSLNLETQEFVVDHIHKILAARSLNEPKMNALMILQKTLASQAMTIDTSGKIEAIQCEIAGMLLRTAKI